MGWSLDLLNISIDKIFGKIKHQVVKPDAIRHYVYFNYEGEIDIDKKRQLVKLFPDDVFVIFHPNTLGPDEKSGPSPMSQVSG
ncbi:hypothetical protein LCGC14_2810090, partial [marine sediment metagenome]